MFPLSWCGHKEEEEMDEEKENQTRDDASQYSLAGVLLPSLGATAIRGSRRPKPRPFIISPYNHRYK